MIRRAAVVVLALTLNPALLRAQDLVLTVNAQSADVYKGPSTVYPVIGHVARGAVLPVSRNLGSWIKIAWPDAKDGIGYVHTTTGRLGRAGDAAPAASFSPRATTSSSPAAPATRIIPPGGRTSLGEPVAPLGRLNDTPASHIVGVGGLFGSMSSVGATARVWPTNHFGMQFGFTRATSTSDFSGRTTSMQFEPAVAYALFDRVTDYVWIRPYVGSALSFRRTTFGVASPGDLTVRDNGVGYRIFGGGELTFASMPRFGLSADLGYRRYQSTLPGLESDRVSAAIAGHWYIK